MVTRHMNFNAGPSAIPLPALERAQKELLDFEGTGMSILEHSHRGKAYEKVHDEAIALLTGLLGIPDSHQVLFMQGGASAQFALVPMNLRTDTHAGDYVITDTWGKKAYQEAKVVGKPHVAWDENKEGRWTRVPKQNELKLTPDAPYVHLTSNNTIMGTQFFEFPSTGSVPLVVDMSSDILWKPIDVSKFGLIYAGAQKNMGPAGITAVIIRKDLIEKGRTDLPSIFRYAEIAKNNSLQNTITTFTVYMIRNVLQWVKEQGGVTEMEKRNRKKAELLYSAIDGSSGYYTCPAEKASRSVMNVVFKLPSEDLDGKFVAEASKAGLVGLKGHRLVGGIRASIYNAVPVEGVEKLVDFMNRFRKG
ncbi:MAG: 3-phosphoserine/phosphohydroxythreonine transaminase [Polyangiales bacterium]